VRTTKRSARCVTLAVGLALIAAACGSDNDKTATISSGGTDSTTAAADTTVASTETSAAPETSASASSGGTVTYAAEQEYTAYNNGSADQVLFANTLVLNMVQPGPFISMPDLTYKLWDDMMVSAEVTSDDPQVVEYVVKPEAAWSDGDPIDCDDFMLAWYSNNGLVTKPNPDFTAPGVLDADGAEIPETLPVFNTASTTGYKDISSVECSDDGKTITTTYSKVFADWKALFGNLLPAHIVEANAKVPDLLAVDGTTLSPELEALGDFWNTGFVGFDPAIDISGSWFSIDSFTAGQNLILKRNEAFFGKPAALDSIVFLQVPDATQQPAALENGDVQVISPQPNPDLVQQIQGIEGVNSEIDQGVTFEHLDFNQGNKHLADINVRKAIALCIDRDEIVSTLVAPINPDATVLNNRIYIPASPDYKDNSKGLTRDVAGAKALLESSGYVLGADGIYAKDGDRLSLRLGRRDPNPRRQSTNELVAEQCKEAGIEMTDDPSEDFNAVRLPASDYDIALFAWVATAALSSNTAIYVPPTEGGDQNWNNYSNPALVPLFAQADGELDAAKRADLMNQIDSIMWDDMATLPLFQFQEMIASTDTVSNVVYNGPLGVTWNANEWTLKS
jgi:peptide/nickel transport system substrate-binding protein